MKASLATRLALVWLVLPLSALAEEFLVGYGTTPYDPFCAEACLQSFTLYLLGCSKTQVANQPFDPISPPTTPACYAQDTPFLTSVAWCISTHCAEYGVSTARLEAFWTQRVTGSKVVRPKWAYAVALANVDPQPPTYQLNISDTHLNRTSLVVPDKYQALWNAVTGLYRAQASESTYSIVLFVVAVGLPVALTWIRYLPFVQAIADRISPYLIYPSLLGRYHVQPLPFLLGNAPTVGQGIYIAVFVALNVILTAVDYRAQEPNAFYLTEYKEICTYILTRTGAFAFMLLPVLLLFSSRNNILLYMTDWPHSTYFLLHRWIARLFLVHVIIHSILSLRVYSFFENTSWWYWGIVATVLSVVLTVGSGLYVRKFFYESFLVGHVILAVLVFVGSWYHLVQWYAYLGRSVPNNTLAYEIWLFFAAAVWFFDRLVRVGRVLRNGLGRARVTELDGGGYVRVDIPGVRWGAGPGRHAFVHFPTLVPWRPWENHPFSVVPTSILRGQELASPSSEARTDGDEEKQLATATAVPATKQSPTDSSGVTFFVRKSSGMTGHLRSGPLLTLLDGPYASSSTREVLRCDRVLLVAGGIGITGALAWAYSHWNVRLVWSVGEHARCLVEAVDLSRVANKEVRVGSRFNIDEVIADEESAGWARVGVVVCGPGGFCDDARAAVVAAGRRGGTVFELQVDAFSW